METETLQRFSREMMSLYVTTEGASVFLDAFKGMYLELYSRGPEFKL